MTITFVRKKKPLKTNVYKTDDLEITFHTNREEFRRLWNERRLDELFNRIGNERRTPRFIY